MEIGALLLTFNSIINHIPYVKMQIKAIHARLTFKLIYIYIVFILENISQRISKQNMLFKFR